MSRPEDCAAQIVAGILVDLTDRRGLRHQWELIDDDIRSEIVESWGKIAAEHLRECHAGQDGGGDALIDVAKRAREFCKAQDAWTLCRERMATAENNTAFSAAADCVGDLHDRRERTYAALTLALKAVEP